MTVSVKLNDDEKDIYFQSFKFEENSRVVIKHHSFVGYVIKDGATIDLTGNHNEKYNYLEMKLEEET